MVPRVPNGKHVKPYNNSVGSLMLFKCLPRYTLVGNPESRCMEDGQWSVPNFKCVISMYRLFYERM